MKIDYKINRKPYPGYMYNIYRYIFLYKFMGVCMCVYVYYHISCIIYLSSFFTIKCKLLPNMVVVHNGLIFKYLGFLFFFYARWIFSCDL